MGSGHVTGQSCLCQGYLLFPVSASCLQHPSHTRKSRMILIYEARLTIDHISWLLLTFSSLLFAQVAATSKRAMFKRLNILGLGKAPAC